MTLAEINRGEEFEIADVADDIIRVQALRFGISEGAKLKCEEIIPGGPVIIKRNLQEIAVGRKLAKNITVKQISK